MPKCGAACSVWGVLKSFGQVAPSRCLGVCVCQVETAQAPLESILTPLDENFQKN